MASFKMGMIVATPGALLALHSAGQCLGCVLLRHGDGDCLVLGGCPVPDAVCRNVKVSSAHFVKARNGRTRFRQSKVGGRRNF